MRIGFRHYVLDAQDILYHVPNAAFDRMLRDPVRHRLPRFANQRIRSAEIAVVLMNGKPIVVERSCFSVLTFKKNGALVSPLADRHVRARAELALALEQPIRGSAVADASTRFLARGGQWSPLGACQATHRANRLGPAKMRACVGRLFPRSPQRPDRACHLVRHRHDGHILRPTLHQFSYPLGRRFTVRQHRPSTVDQ
jgi:hypothetical protein